MRSLMQPLSRKSIQPITALVAPDDRGQVHHFVATSGWDCAPLAVALARKAQQLLVEEVIQDMGLTGCRAGAFRPPQ
jgi:hypothetical protein